MVYRQLLDQYPKDKVAEQAHFGLIQTLSQRGQNEKAAAETEAFRRSYPKSILLENATLIQAEAQFGQKSYNEALPLYQKSLAGAKDPQVAETIEFRIASCYFNLEQFDKARDAFSALPKKYPQGKLVTEALLRLGQTYYEIANRATDPKITQPNLAEAAKAYEEIRARHPLVVPANIHRHSDIDRSTFAARKHGPACTKFRRKLDPGDAFPWPGFIEAIKSGR